MFGISNIPEGVDLISKADTPKDFQSAVGMMCDYLRVKGYSTEYAHKLEGRAYLTVNEYSDKDTKEKLKEAKGKVLEYINDIMEDRGEEELLLKVLNNFHFFLDGLLYREPHKNAGIQKEDLQRIRIKNEYDIQFLLYAYLRPIYPMIRNEVSEDVGYGGTVRPDFVIDDTSAIEVKCTRQSMRAAKLKEEIAADITNYSENNIYFFIYDKEKIIENPETFRAAYERKNVGKKIHIIIHSPKTL